MNNVKLFVCCIFLLAEQFDALLIVNVTEESHPFLEEVVVQSQSIRPYKKPVGLGKFTATFITSPTYTRIVEKDVQTELVKNANLKLNRNSNRIADKPKEAGPIPALFRGFRKVRSLDATKRDSKIIQIELLDPQKHFKREDELKTSKAGSQTPRNEGKSAEGFEMVHSVKGVFQKSLNSENIGDDRYARSDFRTVKLDEEVPSQRGYAASLNYLSAIVRDFQETEEYQSTYDSTIKANNGNLMEEYLEEHLSYRPKDEDSMPLRLKIRIDNHSIELPTAQDSASLNHDEERDFIAVSASDEEDVDDEEDEEASEDEDLEDYRIELQESLLQASRTESKALCTKTGLMCDSCDRVATCIDQGDGTYVKHIIALCPNGTHCLNGTCSISPNPQCDGTVNKAFPCTSTGMFPDPFYCTLYHFCPPPFPARVTAFCDINFAYNPGSTFCDIPVESARTCNADNDFSYPVPLCISAGQSGSVTGAPSLYYLCKRLDRKLYPFVYKCPRGGLYVTNKCVAKKVA